MIERLARALEHIDELPAGMQEELAEQIEQYAHVAEQPAQTQSAPKRRSFAGIWNDLPDDMEETLLRWRHEAEPTPPMDEQLRWSEDE